MKVSTVISDKRNRLVKLDLVATWGWLVLRGSVEPVMNVPGFPLLATEYWKVWGTSVGVLIHSDVIKIGHEVVFWVVLEPYHAFDLVSKAFNGPDGHQVCMDVYHSIVRCCDFLDRRLKKGVAWLVLAPTPGNYGDSVVISNTLGLDSVNAWKL